MILHIPHSSTFIPQNIRDAFLLSDSELEDELLRMTDAYTDDFYNFKGEKVIPVVFPVSRLVVDPERFMNDKDEPMAKKGMGVIYLRTSRVKPLRRRLTATEKKNLIEEFYHPHHDKFQRVVLEELSKDNKCLVVDCHSFASRPFPHDPDQSPERPDICIGTDEFHTPPWLTDLACDLFRQRDYSVEVNRPFQGTIVPWDFYKRNRKVSSILIEVNRKLYMNEDTGEKGEKYLLVKEDLRYILEEILASFHPKPN